MCAKLDLIVSSKMVFSLDRWVSSKAVAVITGTSSGIGAATAELLVKNGLTVVGIARRVERVEELAKKLSGEKGKLVPLKVDISVDTEVVKAFEWIKNNVGPVHILINNAAILGAGKEGSLIDGDYEHWVKKFQTNVLGLTLATREAVRQMRENNINGHIINLNSTVGHKVPNFPNLGSYTATKYAVTALTEALRNELREAKTKIKVTSISPGAVRTEMSAGVAPDATPMQEAEDLADAVFYVLSTPEHVQVHELTVRAVGEEF